MYLLFWTCRYSLHILDKSPSSNIWFINILYHRWVVILLSWWCFLKYKIFNFLKSDFLKICFLLVVLMWYLSKYWLTRGHKHLLLFSSKSFKVLPLTFRSITCCELICGLSEVGVQLHFFVCEYSVIQKPFVENTMLSPLNCLDTLLKIDG